MYASAVSFEATKNADGTVSVTMATKTTDATIHYTTDGTTPTAESATYTTPITVNADTTFTAIAVKDGIEGSPISYAKISISEMEIIKTEVIEKEYVSAVEFTAKDTDSGVELTLSTATAGAEIHYTTDGTTPSASSTAYTAAIAVSENTTIKAIAIKDGLEDSPVSVATVRIKKIPALSGTAPLSIALSTPEELSRTTTTVTVKITSADAIKRVVYKKNGSINAAALLADGEASEATATSDNSVWTFSADERTTYTVAAIDEAGREETAQIVTNVIDQTPPAEVTLVTSNYFSTFNSVEIKWTDPAASTAAYDSPFDHVLITYTIDDTDEIHAVPETIAKGKGVAAISGIDDTAELYTFTVHTVDALGNVSTGTITRCYINNIINATADDVVTKIGQMTQSGTVKVTGAITTDKIKEINIALKNMAKSYPDAKVSIDISETTGITKFWSSYGSNCNDVFYKCPNLKSIILPNTITEIGQNSFDTCTSLVSIIIPESVTIIGAAFSECSALKEIIIPDTVTELNGSYCFYKCTALSSVTLGTGITSLPMNCFDGCTALKSITIPRNITYLSYDVFKDCTALTDISYTGTKAEWETVKKLVGWNKSVPATVVHCSDGDVAL